MANVIASDFRSAIAQRIDAAQHDLASRWLEALTEFLPLGSDDVFPGSELLGHAPAVIREVAGYLQHPAHESVAASSPAAAMATELGHLRHAQGASLHQVLREYRVLRAVITRFIDAEIGRLGLKPAPSDVIQLLSRLDAALGVLLQITSDTFIAEYTESIKRHTARLEAFNRMVTHELRQPLGTFQFALKLLGAEDAWTDRAKRDRLLATAERNLARMNETLGKLVALSRSAEGAGNPFVQRVDLSAVAADVAAQLREMAEARGVEIRVVDQLPTITVDLARLELVLVNLVSNAIKYSDPDKPLRVVEITREPDGRSGFCTLAVRDNGIGISENDLRSIFARFYRGHAAGRDRELRTAGLGLGLSIVADCVDALRGDIRVESTLGQGTTFSLELPVAAEV